jgi:hypothetical protein
MGNPKADNATWNYFLQGFHHYTNTNTMFSTSLSRKLSIRGVLVMHLLGILQDYYTVMHFKFTINNVQCFTSNARRNNGKKSIQVETDVKKTIRETKEQMGR